MQHAVLILLALAYAYIGFRGLSRPGYSFASVWAMYGTEQLLQQHLPYFNTHTALANIIPVSMCSAAVFFHIVKGLPVLWTEKTQIRVVALYAWALLSYFWSVSPHHTSNIFWSSAPYVVGFCLIGPLCITSREDLEDAFNSFLIVCGPLLLGLSIAEMNGQRIVFLDGTFGNSLATGSLGAYAAIIALTRNIGEHRRLYYIWKCGIVLLGLYVTLRSGSRGQLIGAVIAMGIGTSLILTMIRNRTVDKALFAIAAIVALGIYGVLEFGVKEFGYGKRWDVDIMVKHVKLGRIDTAAGLLSIFADDDITTWILGLGSSSSYKLIGYYCHVTPVEVLCELGLVGALLFASILVVCARDGLGAIRSVDNSVRDRIAIASLWSLFVLEFILQWKQGSLLGQCGFLGTCIVMGRVAIPLSERWSSLVINGPSRRRPVPAMVSAVRPLTG